MGARSGLTHPRLGSKAVSYWRNDRYLADIHLAADGIEEELVPKKEKPITISGYRFTHDQLSAAIRSLDAEDSV